MDDVTQLPGPIRRVIHELRLSANVFRDYERQHQDKAIEADSPTETDARLRKAKRNRERAMACEEALAGVEAMQAARPQSPALPSEGLVELVARLRNPPLADRVNTVSLHNEAADAIEALTQSPAVADGVAAMNRREPEQG